MQSVPYFINGEQISRSSERYHTVYNPATGTAERQVPFATDSELERAIVSAQEAFCVWQHTPAIKRSQVLFNFRHLLSTHLEELSALITQEHGKVLDDARGEVKRAIELVEHCCGIPHLLQGQYSTQVSQHMDCYNIRQPLGVCVGITPFNFPVMISTWMAIPAIACGNSFILKPSEKDPSSVLLLAQLLQEAGLPNGVVNVVNGDKTAAEYLITHPQVSAVSCVGSTPVAEHVYQTAIAHGKRAQAFGGAKNHAIVMPDAIMDEVVPALLGAGYGAAGERCMAISAVIAVTDDVADHLVKRISKQIPSLCITNGSNEKADMGPLISAEHRERVQSYIELGIKEGATLVVDGRQFQAAADDSGFFLGASLFDHVTPQMRIYQEEIFGPVLVVLRVPDYASALHLVNSHQYGNGAAIFTQSGSVARDFACNVQAGMVGINVPIPVPIASHPFGGWKRSVFGDTPMHGEEGIRFYTKSKSITARWSQQSSEASHFQMPTHN